MADFASGTWNMVDSHNFDEYMKAVGVGFVMRKLGNLAKPVQHISVEGGDWNIKTVTSVKSHDFTYKVGDTLEEVTMDGRGVKTTTVIEDTKLILKQDGDHKSTIIRDFNGDKMVMTLETNGITCTRNYERAT